MNPFIQKIGIFYKNKNWADYIRDSIVRDSQDDIVYHTKDEIVFKDASVVRFRPANDSARGYRWTTVFIQAGIDYEAFCTIIRPKVLWRDRCYVINDYEGLTPFGNHYIAERYYQGMDYVRSHFNLFESAIDDAYKKEYECVWGNENEI